MKEKCCDLQPRSRVSGAYSGVFVAAHTLLEDRGSATSELFRSGALQKIEGRDLISFQYSMVLVHDKK